MSYFEDLSEYRYIEPGYYAGTRNVGWLEPEFAFETAAPSEDLINDLWAFCTISVAQTRGFFVCRLCGKHEGGDATYKGVELSLGSAEIRVISRSGEVFAAPTLIFHYVRDHHYCPPSAFLEALKSGERPPDAAYFKQLEAMGLEWNPTKSLHGKTLPPGWSPGMKLPPGFRPD